MRSFSCPPVLAKKSFNTLFVSFSVAALISACAPEASLSDVAETGAISAQAENLTETDSPKQVQIRWTTHGIPHIKVVILRFKSHELQLTTSARQLG